MTWVCIGIFLIFLFLFLRTRPAKRPCSLCNRAAEWEVHYEPFEDYTECCSWHLGQLLDPSRTYQLYLIKEEENE
jgi:hypothetical protein